MTQVVQARCPHCKNVLRIPADWLDQPMRCKHCKQVFQARGKGAAALAGANAAAIAPGIPMPAPPMVAPPVAAPPVAAPAMAAPAMAAPAMMAPPRPVGASPSPIAAGPGSNGDPFSFDAHAGDMIAPPVSRHRRRSSAGWWIGLGVMASVLAVGTTVFFLAGDEVKKWFRGGSAHAGNTDKKEDKFQTDKGLDKHASDKGSSDKSDKGSSDKSDKAADKGLPDKGLPDKGIRDKSPGDKSTDKRPGDKRPGDKRPGDKRPGDKPADKKIVKPPAEGPHPRRALLISVCNYLYANSVSYGTEADNDPKGLRKGVAYPGSSTSALKTFMESPPMKIPYAQMAEMTDGFYTSRVKNGKPPLPKVAPFKVNIEHAITEFLATSRPQDRVILLFAGHAVDIDKESYLVPLEGDLADAGTLIPLTWVYSKLKGCPALEKVLILDVCRFPPDRGFELPGGGEPGTGKMTEQLDARLKNPPPGVQVWSACVKDQNSIELDRGSVFLRALCGALQEQPRPISEQNQALPLRLLEKRVNAKMKALLSPQSVEQVSRLSGAPAADGGYDPKAPPPPAITLKSVVPGGNDPVGLELARDIKNEIDWVPPVRQTRQNPFLPPLPVKSPDFYKNERDFNYKTFADLKTRVMSNKEKYPIRVAVIDAIEALNQNNKLQIVEKLYGGSSVASKQTKAKFFRDQQGPGMSIFELEQVLGRLEAAKEKLAQEPSKRWQAHFQYTLAKFESRVVYLYEYNFILAQVRGDQLPEIDPKIHTGWRVGSRPRVSISESKVKDMVKSIGRTWKAIMEDYPDTPWAVLAKRERLTALGLEWRPLRD